MNQQDRRLLSEAQQRIREGFLVSVYDIRSEVTVAEVAASIADGSAIAITVDQVFFGPLDEAMRQSYVESMRALRPPRYVRDPATGNRLVVRFDGRHPRAEAWMRQQSSRLITEIVSSQREAIQVALEAGLADGRNPRRVALDIVGRINRATGRREGGIIGLHRQFADYVVNARRELENLNSSYFQRMRRDRRFDSMVRKAIREGKPLSAADVDRIVNRYSDRLLALRGETIARTEALTGLTAGRDEAMQQLVETGVVQPQDVRITWRWTGGATPPGRDMHREMDGKSVGLNEMFVMPDGVMMRFPHDPAGGAEHNANCRCFAEQTVDWITAQQRQEAA